MDHTARFEHALAILGAHDPSATDVALERSIGPALRQLSEHPDAEQLFGASLLSADGYPVELTFSSMDPCVRYTLDSSLATASIEERLAETLALLARLDEGHRWSEVQERDLLADGSALRWGAWLGVRHRAGGMRYKLYAELSELAARAIAPDYEELITDIPLRPVALGLELERGLSEYYFIFEEFGLSWSWIDRLLFRLDMHDRSREMLEVFQQLRGFDRPEHAPSFVNTRYGCSVSFDASRRAIAFSLFAFARHMGESDARIREHIAKISADRGWDMSGYLARVDQMVICS